MNLLSLADFQRRLVEIGTIDSDWETPEALDSVQQMEVCLFIEEQMGVWIPASVDLANAQSISALYNLYLELHLAG
jgi:hypothetical protein